MSKRKAEDMEAVDWENEPCPLCTRESLPKDAKIQWIACEYRDCATWFHCSCVGASAQTVSAFFCEECSRLGRGTTQQRVERPKRAGNLGIDYTALDAGEHVNSLRHLYSSIIESRSFSKVAIRKLTGAQLTKGYLDEHGFTEPIVVHEPSDLGMTIPFDLTVDQVAESVGPDTHIEVMDVPTQGEDKGWNLGRWASYYNDQSPSRVRNVISLEISDSDLGKSIVRPQIVRDLDLLNNFWPKKLFTVEDMPKVQTYCLMSLQNSYTDFHIDFAGTSVYYHIVQGSKTFLFIPPTPANLKKYSDWCLSSHQSKTFLADECKETFKVELNKGDTMLIPPGWIHAVHTPTKSLVIGGNFLHLHGLQKHLEVAEIENKTKVPGKFRFPQFDRTLWFTAIGILVQRPHLCNSELLGVVKMAEYLHGRAVADTEKIHRKASSDDVSRTHLVGSPAMLARLLHSYARSHMPESTTSDDEIYKIRPSDYTSQVILVKADVPFEKYEQLLPSSEPQEAQDEAVTTIENERFVEAWFQLPLMPSELPQVFIGSSESRGRYEDVKPPIPETKSEITHEEAKSPIPESKPKMTHEEVKESIIFADNNYIPPLMAFTSVPDSPPNMSTLSAASSNDANKNSTTCFRCKTRKRRCDKERPCKSCIEAGLEKSCLDSGSYAGTHMPSTVSPGTSTNSDKTQINNMDTLTTFVPTPDKPKTVTKPLLPKVKKLRKPGARCGRCAKDKKQCGREEPICDRCQKKGLDATECIYPHQLLPNPSDASSPTPTLQNEQQTSVESPPPPLPQSIAAFQPKMSVPQESDVSPISYGINVIAEPSTVEAIAPSEAPAPNSTI